MKRMRTHQNRPRQGILRPGRRRAGGRREPAGTRAGQAPALELKVRAATASRWDDLTELFGARGACGGCWCMTWRRSRKAFEAGKGDGNRRALRALVFSGRRPGLIGYLGKEPVAWCSVAPREEFPALGRSRVLAPVDGARVWSVSCLFVKRPHRRRGISSRMLRAAVEFAARRGARVVEGYPVVPSMERTPDPFVWTGLPSAFKAAGFREALRRSPLRPIMRLEIRPRRGA